MSVLNEDQWLGAPSASYQIQRSLRFNSPDSALLSRTFGTPTTQGTFTFSAWVKRSNLGSLQQLFGVSTNHSFGFTSGDALNLTFGGVSALTTTALFRDPSAWYHIVWTQSSASHTIYVNNASVGTATATSSVFNTAVAHQIGAANTTNYLNGYLADIHFIDGQALTPASFGQTDATTGEWVPIAYTGGSYGTNGFKLNFADNSAATAVALGKDTSGNSNNWTPNNLSVTAGAGNDSLVDTPTSYGTDTGVGGEVRGNYCTLNPLVGSANAKASLSDGCLQFTNAATNSYYATGGTFGMSSGKWYFELAATTLDVSRWANVGIANTLYDYADSAANGVINAWTQYSNGGYFLNSASGVGVGTYATGDVVMVAFDADSGKLWFGKNGTWNSGSPAAGTTPVATVSSGTYFPVVRVYTNTTVPVVNLNFGQRQWVYQAPAGFKALCDTNLPAPTIVKPSTVMDTVLYTGTGTTLTPTSSLGFSPDLVWIKGRSGATDHALYDTVRGATLDMSSSSFAAETTQTQGLTAFNSNGFTVGTLARLNTSTATYAGWCWDAGSSNASNTSGTISSTVRANTTAGFSIVSYTGNGTAGATIGHGLGVVPSMIIVKGRSVAQDWAVKHVSLTAGQVMYLNTQSEPITNPNIWNTTNPTSSVFTVSADSHVNTNGGTYVAFCFAPVNSYSSFGSYTGNGSADGPFVYTGFRPRWVMIKQTTSASTTNWVILDAARIGYNVDNNPLWANAVTAEGTTDLVDITSNGFKIRSTDASVNAASGTYIYATFAEFPFQYARAR